MIAKNFEEKEPDKMVIQLIKTLIDLDALFII